MARSISFRQALCRILRRLRHDRSPRDRCRSSVDLAASASWPASGNRGSIAQGTRPEAVLPQPAFAPAPRFCREPLSAAPTISSDRPQTEDRKSKTSHPPKRLNHTVRKEDALAMTELLPNGNFLLSVQSGAVSIRISITPMDAEFLFCGPEPSKDEVA